MHKVNALSAQDVLVALEMKIITQDEAREALGFAVNKEDKKWQKIGSYRSLTRPMVGI